MARQSLFFSGAGALLLSIGLAEASPGVAYMKVVKAKIPLHVIQVDVTRKDVRLAVITAEEGIGHLESWSSLIERAQPAAALTGTYFDTITGVPVGSLGFMGQQIHTGLIGTAFSFSPGAMPFIQSARPNTHFDFPVAETFFRAGPRLMSAGGVTLYPSDEGFQDPSVFRRARRTAVATTNHGKLLLIATTKPVLLRELAGAIKALGAEDAMCMDGGSSAALYFRGKSQVVPRRLLTNALVVYDSTQRYDDRAAMLNPGFPSTSH